MDDHRARMPKFAANLTMLFSGLPFLERFGARASAGFQAVEFLFPYDYSIAELREQLVAGHIAKGDVQLALRP
jgi:hydroxypyruvate isomerase